MATFAALPPSGRLEGQFEAMVSSLQAEVRVLKQASALRAGSESVEQQLRQLQPTMLALERSADEIEAFVAEEEARLDELRALAEVVALQQRMASELQQAMPQYLAPGATAAAGSTVPPAGEAGGLVLTLVTARELETVPTSTRGRATLHMINSAAVALGELLTHKQRALHQAERAPPGRRTAAQTGLLQERDALACPEHEGQPAFLTESEVRSALQLPGATGVAVLSSLRALGRLRLVKARGSTNTYVPRCTPETASGGAASTSRR